MNSTKQSQKLAIIVPYRNREEHLEKFTPAIKEHLKDSDIDYKIVIVEQTDDGPFNKGKLLNIGFNAAKHWADYFIFHDVDSLPENKECDYSYTEKPTLLSKYIQKENYKEVYKTFFGCVVGINKEDFIKINGVSNRYLGWGIVDDDMYYRCYMENLEICRRDGRYLSLDHEHDDDSHLKQNSLTVQNNFRFKFLLTEAPLYYKHEGLNTLNADLSISRIDNYIYVKALV
jgi:beta-1,4-galactosyltransferase 1